MSDTIKVAAQNGLGALARHAVDDAGVAGMFLAQERQQLLELLFPVTENVRLHPTKFADFTDRKVTFRRNRRQIAVNPRIQHMLPPLSVVFGRVGKSPRGERISESPPPFWDFCLAFGFFPEAENCRIPRV